MLQQPTRIVREALDLPAAQEEYGIGELLEARNSFWQYRILMNPRFVLREQWFPRTLSRKLRKFWDDFKAGKRPVMLLECRRSMASRWRHRLHRMGDRP